MKQGSLRRQFALPEEDSSYMDSLGLPWETVKENGVMRLIVYDFPVPEGYSAREASLNLRIDNGYPDAPLDMVYIHPPLRRVDTIPIGGTSSDMFDGKEWQRWSRHRTNRNPWMPGVDCIETHLLLVEDWLRREFGKR